MARERRGGSQFFVISVLARLSLLRERDSQHGFVVSDVFVHFSACHTLCSLHAPNYVDL